MFTGRLCGGNARDVGAAESTRPSFGRSKPAMMRSSVVLPQPDGPSSVTNSPSADGESDIVERRTRP